MHVLLLKLVGGNKILDAPPQCYGCAHNPTRAVVHGKSQATCHLVIVRPMQLILYKCCYHASMMRLLRWLN